MFESLKKKLSGWLGKKPVEQEKTAKAVKKPKKIPKKQVKKKIEEIKQIEKQVIGKIESPSPTSQEKELTPPTKFNVGLQKFEPDTEQLKDEATKLAKKDKVKIEPDNTEREVSSQMREAPQSKDEEAHSDSESDSEPEEAGFFSRLIKKFNTKTLTQEQFDEVFMELEMILLENNVALEVVDKIRQTLQEDLVGIELKKDKKIDEEVINSLKQSILDVLHEPEDLIKAIKQKNPNEPYVIVFFGINGSGKTTSLAKLANYLEKNKLSCVLAAADTFRAASIEQLKIHADKLKIPVIASQYGADPASVAFDAISHAKKHNKQVVLIDTAGRMYTKADLMREMEKIIRVSKPDLKLFVGESITGNDATEQARTFHETIDIDGIILTKADVDDKAGTILSVSHITQKPIYFLGVGQGMDDLQEFKKADVLKHLGL